MKYFVQTSFILYGEPVGNHNDWFNADSPSHAKAQAMCKYSGYGAEYGYIDIMVMTANEYDEKEEDHIYASATYL